MKELFQRQKQIYRFLVEGAKLDQNVTIIEFK